MTLPYLFEERSIAPEIGKGRASGAPWNLEDTMQGRLICQKGGVGRPCQIIDPGLGKVFP
jgi:hypothetical protein